MSAEGVVVADVRKNARETFRIRLSEYQGYKFIDLRLWYNDGVELRPGPKGIAIKPDTLSAVIAALQEAQARLDGPQ